MPEYICVCMCVHVYIYIYTYKYIIWRSSAFFFFAYYCAARSKASLRGMYIGMYIRVYVCAHKKSLVQSRFLNSGDSTSIPCDPPPTYKIIVQDRDTHVMWTRDSHAGRPGTASTCYVLTYDSFFFSRP
jgi:hypothetical protein